MGTIVVLVLVFLFIEVALLLLVGAYWVKAAGDLVRAAKLQEAGGAFVFIFCIFGWHLELGLMLQSMDFPYELPMFDLSAMIPGTTDENAAKQVSKREFKRGRSA